MNLRLPKGITIYDGIDELLKNGDVPISVLEIMKLRVEKGDKFPVLWAMNCNTSDLIIYPRGNLEDIYLFFTKDFNGQITTDGIDALKIINSNNLELKEEFVNILIDAGSENLKVVSRYDIHNNEYFSEEEVLNEKIWNVLSRGDKELLEKYSKAVVSRTWISYNMATDINDISDLKKQLVTSLCLCGPELKSAINGKGVFDNTNSYFLGAKSNKINKDLGLEKCVI